MMVGKGFVPIFQLFFLAVPKVGKIHRVVFNPAIPWENIPDETGYLELFQ
jgi:hypothetical protein